MQYNEHSVAHHVMLTGRTPKPIGFDSGRPKPSDFSSIAAVVAALAPRRNNVPPAAVLPEKLVHVSGRTIFQALGLPRTIVWKDRLDRPHHVYHGDPIRGLTG